MKTSLPTTLLIAVLSACSSASDAASRSDGTSATSRPATATEERTADDVPTSRPSGAESVGQVSQIDGAEYEMRGAGVAPSGETLTVSALAASAEEMDGKRVRVSGTVQSVCKKKGCWMRLQDGGKEVFVRFKDYGFFMPLDCEGRAVILEGTFMVKETPVDELRHYLEDEGRHEEAKKITEPKVELKVIADGVALRREKV